MTGPEGNGKFCFPESLNGKHLDSFGGKQCHCEITRDLEVTKESEPCLEEISGYISIRSLPASLLFKDQGTLRITMNWPVLFGAAHHSKFL